MVQNRNETDSRGFRDRAIAAQLLVQVVMAIFLAAITGINAWALHQVITLDRRVTVNEGRIEAFMSGGPRYTTSDALRDYGVILNLLEKQGKHLDDHEGRIRVTEKAIYQRQ